MYSARRLPIFRCVYRLIVGVAALLLVCGPLPGYSVLTHEAIIDSAWDTGIKKALLARFPDATPEALVEAHSYAYAGCILQDMGYYPFGSRFFSDLVHYVRSGDFVANLIRESQDLNEYAFAMGALAHYEADTEGHSIAVNRSVAMEYSKLERKYGRSVTYEDDPTAHLRVEFSFDVLQIARGNYAPQSYHDFIGFRVSEGVLERAFHDTYSLDLTDVFSDLDTALATYRRTVSVVIPAATRAAWKARKADLAAQTPGVTRRKFVYNISEAAYRREWDGQWRKRGIGFRMLEFLIRILPKVGPLKALAFQAPGPQAERLFQDSFDRTLDDYRRQLLTADLAHPQLPERNLDTGEPTRPAAYRMADACYASLAAKLAERDPSTVDAKLRAEVLAYFADRNQPFAEKKNKKAWEQTLAALDKLKAQAAANDGAAVR